MWKTDANVGLGPLAESVVTPEMQQRIAARDDWAFVADNRTGWVQRWDREMAL